MGYLRIQGRSNWETSSQHSVCPHNPPQEKSASLPHHTPCRQSPTPLPSLLASHLPQTPENHLRILNHPIQINPHIFQRSIQHLLHSVQRSREVDDRVAVVTFEGEEEGGAVVLGAAEGLVEGWGGGREDERRGWLAWALRNEMNVGGV